MVIECCYCYKLYLPDKSDANKTWQFCSNYCEQQQTRKDCGLSHGIYLTQDEEC